MNNRIKILPPIISNKIAAGEVISRPESVIKELIENSIDAKANSIDVIIKDAGKSLIQVSDNGTGMAEEDAVISFLRHSTSKITKFEDLDNIKTLGFRGEALASIASISQLEIKTKTEDNETATNIRIEDNEIIENSKTNHPTGTSILVKNLFYNTPARRNFLKSDQTELKHLYETFIRLALSHHNINFKLVNNSNEIFNLKHSDLKERIRDIFGEDFLSNLIKFEGGNPILSVKGYISKPNFTKKTKADQFFFLNNRYFVNRNLNFAVYSAYDDLIEKGNYPSYIIFIDIDPSRVDVNVHPSKLEVKFEEESAVFGFLKKLIRETLSQNDLTFNIGFKEPDSLSLIKGKSEFRFKENLEHKSNFQNIINTRPENSDTIFGEDTKKWTADTSESDSIDLFLHNKKETTSKFNIWQYQYKYIMYETDAGLMIIDQHAAHERILYEKVRKMFDSNSSFSQQLIMPVIIKLSEIDYNLATSLKNELINLGFNFKFLDNNRIEINGIPPDIRLGEENTILTSLIEQYREYEVSLNLEKRDNLAKSFACRGAVKTGEKLEYDEMVGLIDNLFDSEMPFVCPHGRPTVIRITLEELDKRFSRS